MIEEFLRKQHSLTVLLVNVSNNFLNQGAYDTAHSDDVDQSFRFDADQIGAKRRKALSV